MTEVELITFDNNSRKSDKNSTNLAKVSKSYKESLDKGERLLNYFKNRPNHDRISKNLRYLNSLNKLGSSISQDSYDRRKYSTDQLNLGFSINPTSINGVNTLVQNNTVPQSNINSGDFLEKLKSATKVLNTTKVENQTPEKDTKSKSTDIESLSQNPIRIANAVIASKAYNKNSKK